MKNKIKPFVSVVIPVYNDSERLQICLNALENQTYPKNRYEIVIVDDGSSEKIRNLISRCNRVHFVRQKKKGSYAARNKGISKAKGSIIAFTDSDCIPAKDWIEKGVKKITSISNCGLVAGKINLHFKNLEKPTSVELFEKVTAFQQKKYIKNLKFGATANVFTLRSVIDKVGFLDGTLKSGADLEWGQRIAAAGYRQIYAEDVCVSHPARNSIRQVYRKNIRVINGLNDMKKKKDSLKKFLIDLKDDWPQLDDFGDIFSNEKLSNLSQKIKVFLVMLFVKEVRAFERIKLYFGQKSKRIKIL